MGGRKLLYRRLFEIQSMLVQKMASASKAMEADDYLKLYEALEDSTRQVQIPLRALCPIKKVIWSSFDYLSGPQLGFVWEAVLASSDGSLDDKSSRSSRDLTSLTSSVTKGASSAEYEEIDDAYKSELMTAAVHDLEVCAMCMRAHNGTDLICDNCNVASSMPNDLLRKNELGENNPLYLDELMTASRSTGDCTTTTLTDEDDEQMKLVASLASLSMNREESFKMSGASERDICKVTLTPNMASYKTLSSSVSTEKLLTSTNLTPMEIKTLTSQDKTDKNAQAMITSAVDSGIAGTISMHSDLSAATSLVDQEQIIAKQTVEIQASDDGFDDTGTLISKNNEVEDEDDGTLTEQSVDYDESVDYDALCDLAGEGAARQLSDELFVARSVLAEQVCSIPMPTNPLMHKFTLLSKRQLFVGSYVFYMNGGSGRQRSICAVSLVGDLARWRWYSDRQSIIEEMFVDIIPRLKASFFADSFEDFISHMSSEVTELLTMLGATEAAPFYLCPDFAYPKLRQTYFGDKVLQGNQFLARSITALLSSQAHCVLVGDDHASVLKMMNTLSLFVAEDWRWLCIQPHKHRYSPYLRLQAVEREDLVQVISAGTESHWPIAVIDLDRCIASISENYSKHRVLKLQKQREDVKEILNAAGVDHDEGPSRPLQLTIRSCRADPRVIDFLKRMDLLPFEQSTRYGFVRQFLLVIENSAKAFNKYVEDVSEPDFSDKQNALSKKWSLKEARRALDLTDNASYFVTLAEAEHLRPDVAEFICISSVA